MNRGKVAVLLFVAVAALATIARLTLFQDKSDREMIQAALQESIEAGKEGRPGSVVDLLSNQFEVNGYQPGSREVSRVVKQFKPDVEVLNPVPVVDGDTASMKSPVRLSITMPMKQSFDIQDVKFSFEKEPATQWLIFPSKKWRLRSVELPPDVMSQLGQLGIGSPMGLFGG